MIAELEAVLNRALTLAADELPRFLGELETIRATAWSRLMAAPAAKQASDELIDIKEAARRLGVSRSFLYRNHSQYAFSRREGRSLRFSSHGIQSHIGETGVSAAQTPKSQVTR
jgi:predicted DNA-binding transcriptional regulator AlpA